MLMDFESIEFKLYRPFTSLSSSASASSSFDNDEIRSDGYPSCSKSADIQKGERTPSPSEETTDEVRP